MCIICAQGLQGVGSSRFVPFDGDGGADGGYGPAMHADFEGMFSLLNADQRGGTGPNGRPSLTTTAAGNQLTRTNVSWESAGGGTLGTATTVTFAFRDAAPTTMPDGTTGFTRFTEAQIAFTLLALQSWSDVANITFTRVGTGTSGEGAYSGAATMLFGNYSAGAAGAAAFAFFPGPRGASSTSGDLWFNSTDTNNQSGTLFEYGLLTMVHEIGHTLGIDHPAEYNAGENQPTYTAHATYFEDSYQYTLMSYFDETNTGANFVQNGTRIYPAAPMMDDIVAVQRLYGANMTTRTGDTVYGFNSTADRGWYSVTSAAQAVVFAVWDAGGTDTFDFSGYAQNAIIDLRAGAFSNVGGLVGNVSIAVGVTIENAIGGAGADTIIGNAANNIITGGAGADTMTGGAGADTFRYLATGNSTAALQDTITDFVTGTDRIDLTALNPTSVSVGRLAGGVSVVFAETPGGAFQAYVNGAVNSNDFIFNGAIGAFIIGSADADTIVGSSRPDPLLGNDGADTITGGGGADAIAGGAGRDVFRYVSQGDSNQVTGFDNLYDFVTGEDRIDLNLIGATSISILRTDNGSSFVYAETASGSFLTTAAGRAINGTDFIYSGGFGIYMVGSGVADTLIGTSLADPIAGGAGNDTITGGGGADAMFGDAGADTFVYVAASDSTAAATDGIFGFVSGTDRLDLRLVRTGAADTFGIAYLQGGSFLFVDLGGNGSTDMVIGLANTTLVASDILWATGAIGEEPAVKDTGPQTLPGADEIDLFDTDMAFDLSPHTGRFMLDLEGARGFHGQDWYL
ncbi:hypothetical protein KOAAANKH_03732 [Brevundimonas sp. NIBR10]|uniref:M10 family metallopeptidase C-terminal domain-containing protein n=1 Tax=Brevundimonas sp. NIBR10 TaxID=3015997 RepID=UPI0022F1824D|nr:M10 family metallopeptidase C-terminal domain-containing protein [Brevundimonas sp. NIBR10]WGM48825.1 hypothetical protein KOAAANKH_03732 [Brevundimonas sp. NIBR10]